MSIPLAEKYLPPDPLPQEPSTYTILNPHNCAIGDGAMVINRVERIPLYWHPPCEIRPDLTKGAIGRRVELDELHQRLHAEQQTAVVSTGTSAAVQGQPAIGKSTLAAMYAAEHQDDYVGGILWLQLGPGYREPDSVNGLIQRIATYAYNADAQVAQLENCLFSAEITQALLAGHGPMLAILDDVWSVTALEAVERALPAEARLVVTTRDFDVALAVNGQEATIMKLDVLTPADAQLLLQSRANGLSDDQAAALAKGLDYHAQALVLAAGTLVRRGLLHRQETINEILRRVSAGEGFGALPSPKPVERARIHKFEIALKYSYDYLGEFDNGAECQRKFRALGAFAEGMSFETAAVGALWDDPDAREFLLELQNLGLLKERMSIADEPSDERWQQHPILRAYALSLQNTEEKQELAQRHALYYLMCMRAADDAQRYYLMKPEWPNLRHALLWAVSQNLGLAQALLSNTANLLTSQNLGVEYLAWARRVLEQAKQGGDLAALGQAWGTLGNALQAAAAVGEDRAGRLKEALSVYREALELRRETPLAYAQTLNNMANLLRDLAGLPGEDRAGRLKEALSVYREALGTLRETPLAYAQTLNNMAVLLRDLAGLPGEDRAGRLKEALSVYREALELRRETPLAYAQTLNNMAVLLRDLAGLPGEDRAGRLKEALSVYREALGTLRETPLAYATTLNNMANLLRDLAGLPGEDRAGRLKEALSVYREALGALRETPLDYATTLNNMANLLRDLAGLPGEDRAGRLKEALSAIYQAQQLFRKLQHVPYQAVAFRVLTGLLVAMGPTLFGQLWVEIAPGEPLPSFDRGPVLGELAQQAGIRSNEEFQSRLQADAVFRQQVDELIAFTDTDSQGVADAQLQHLADRLVEWIKTPNRKESEQYLRQHEADLLSDAAETALRLLQEANPGNETIADHIKLLADCRARGIDAAYAQFAKDTPLNAAEADTMLLTLFMRVSNSQEMAELVDQLPEAALVRLVELAEERLAAVEGDEAIGIRQRLDGLRQQRANPLKSALRRFLQASDEAQARDILLAQPDLLLTIEAGETLQRFQSSDPESQAHLEARKALWQQVRLERVAPHQPSSDRGELDQMSDRQPGQPQPESTRAEARETTYTVINPVNSAIGDNALVINNVGRIPLEWKRPREVRSDLIEQAIGRAIELQALRTALEVGESTAITGLSTALHGMPGVGKSTLAALYAARYQDSYPGGVLWVQLTPEYRTAESVNAQLNRLATYAYTADAQAQDMLKYTQFSAETVQALLEGHGALLIVVDDVWAEAALQPLRRALPAGSHLLATTRDARIARGLKKQVELDVLSETDALTMIGEKLPSMPEDLRKQLAAAVGCHPLALAVLIGDLAARGEDEWLGSIGQIETMVRKGEGFDLPLMDELDRESKVEAVLRFSYDAMDVAHRECFRALGCFAQEGDFDTAAAAAVWEQDEPHAQEHLNVFAARSLIKRHSMGRWSQHAILRSYAFQLQPGIERLRFPRRYAEHYLAVVRACYESKPRDNDRLEADFNQVLHAVTWCEQNSPRLLSQIVLYCRDFMMVRGRVDKLNHWLRLSLNAVQNTDDQSGKANTLQSLGDLESRLGNVAAARQHYETALPLFEAEQARLGKANTLKSLGDLERRLGNVAAARQHYETALPLFEAEQDRLGKANTLQSLGDLESRLGNVAAARQHYETALPLFEAEQARLGKANTLQSLGDLESRLGNVAAARQHYETALPLFEAEQARLGKANTLQSLGDLERRLGNVAAARQHYETALPLFEAEQDRLGKANTLKSLGDLERRLGNVAAARQHYETALPLFEAEQEPGGQMNTLISMAHLEMDLANRDQAIIYYQQALEIADSLSEFANHPVVQEWRGELQRLLTGSTSEPGSDQAQHLADLLVAWLQTPNWAASEMYLREHQADLLADAALEVLEMLQKNNPDNRSIDQHIALLRACREQGIETVYGELKLSAALAALLNEVKDDATFREVLNRYPVLVELPALTRLVEGIERAHTEGETQVAVGPLALLIPLLQGYSYQHTENINPDTQRAFIELHQRLLLPAEAMNEPQLLSSVRDSAAQAYSTLGNYYTGRPDEKPRAVEAFTHAIELNAAQAIYYRNRAEVYIYLKQYQAAEQDLNQAQTLEPDARYLYIRRCELHLAQGQATEAVRYAQELITQKPEDADGYFYLAASRAFDGPHDEATTAMVESSRLASDRQRQQGLETLNEYKQMHPQHAEALDVLSAILKEKPNG